MMIRRYTATCGQCGWRKPGDDLDQIEAAAERHLWLKLHEGVEVVRSEEVRS